MVKIDKEMCRKLNDIGIPAEWDDILDSCSMDLSGSNLTASTFKRTDLTNCDFLGAEMDGVRLERANIGGSGMERANMIGNDLTGVDLRMAVIPPQVLLGACKEEYCYHSYTEEDIEYLKKEME